MNRGSGLRRRTPLVAKKALKTRKVTGKSGHRDTGPSAATVDACLERASFSCELCLIGLGPDRGWDWQVQHRRPRQRGGSRKPDTNRPQNLLILCRSCHEVVESERTASYMGGWLVRQSADPAVEPVLIGGERFVLLTPDGRYAKEAGT